MELREKIKNITGTVIKSYPDNKMKVVQQIDPDKIDAILDAVITALPPPTQNDAPYFQGVKSYHDIVVAILQSAKEQK